MALKALEINNGIGTVVFSDVRGANDGESWAAAKVALGMERDIAEALSVQDIAEIHAWTGALLSETHKT